MGKTALGRLVRAHTSVAIASHSLCKCASHMPGTLLPNKGVVSRASDLSSRRASDGGSQLADREDMMEMDDVELERLCGRSRRCCVVPIFDDRASLDVHGALKMYCSRTEAISKDMADDMVDVIQQSMREVKIQSLR